MLSPREAKHQLAIVIVCVTSRGRTNRASSQITSVTIGLTSGYTSHGIRLYGVVKKVKERAVSEFVFGSKFST